MSYFTHSRYLHQPRLQVGDHLGNFYEVPEQRATTVFEAEHPAGTRTVVVEPGESFDSLATDHLGTPALWWLLADFNPHIFYPLDLVDADMINLPPRSSVNQFRSPR